MFATGPRSLPVYLMHGFEGFGQDTTTDWIKAILQPIADVVHKYYDPLYQPQAQKVTQITTPSTTGISPIYLIGGGILVWLLLRPKGGGLKGTERKSRKNPCRRR